MNAAVFEVVHGMQLRSLGRAATGWVVYTEGVQLKVGWCTTREYSFRLGGVQLGSTRTALNEVAYYSVKFNKANYKIFFIGGKL